MSHGPPGAGIKAEPNLTPLLDLVLQLVMFFMLVANFTMEVYTEDVKLPDAMSARPAEKSEVEVLTLNLNQDGKILLAGIPKEPGEVAGYLNDMFKEAQDLAKERKRKDPTQSDEVKTVVIIRGDRNSEFGPIYQILRAAKAAGFRKWQLRVTNKNT
jgi:biopolymer transport protein ExbD